IPRNSGLCDYIKEERQPSRYSNPLEITRKFANDENILEARRKKGEDPKRYDYFEETFLTMCQLKRENGVWWLGTGDHRRRDDDVEEVNNDALAENEEVTEEEEVQNDFDREVMIDEAALQGESELGEKFYDTEDEIEESAAVGEEVLEVPAQASAQQKETEAVGVDPSGLTRSITDSIFSSLQADFERARANRIQADLEKAQAENARLLAFSNKPNHSTNHRIKHSSL
ncbi:hypothetical protein Dimus_030578, partial [Dionaea muscipula]